MTDMEIVVEMWSKMSAFEQSDLYYKRLELIHESWNSIFTMLAMYLSIVTGYLIVAYAAGAQLKRPQVFIASVTYLFGAVMMVAGMVSWGLVINQTYTTNAYWFEFIGATIFAAQSREEAAISPIDIFSWLLLMMGTLAPLYFMWSVRHPKTE
ncbi:MAG: hypothetical protein V7720_06400 [Halioglobus sp.]